MKDKSFKNEYDKAIGCLEKFIINRQYESTPYEIQLPSKIRKEIKQNKIMPVLEKLNIRKVKTYFEKNKIALENLAIYLEYRYLLFYYYERVKELYINSKKYYGLGLHNVKYDSNRKIYTSYKLYPTDFELVINTVNNIPNFEYDNLFGSTNIFDKISDLKDSGIHIELNYDNYKFLENGYLMVGNKKEKLLNFLKVSKLITESKKGNRYNLYDYIYNPEIMDFLEKYKDYFHNCNLNMIKDFYQKTGLKLKYVVEDKYRIFNFDIYGVHGSDTFASDCFDEGIYANFEYEKWKEMQEDYDLCLWFEVAHIDYDDKRNVYYQNVYDKWDPYYEEDMAEEEQLEFTGKESEKIYLYERGENNE